MATKTAKPSCSAAIKDPVAQIIPESERCPVCGSGRIFMDKSERTKNTPILECVSCRAIWFQGEEKAIKRRVEAIRNA